jgi:alpha-mannosidase
MSRPSLGIAMATLAAASLTAIGLARAQSAKPVGQAVAGAEKPPAAAGAAAAQSRSPWPNLEEVTVVSKTHFDIGYTDLASRVVDRYRTSMADQALKLVDQSAGLPPDQRFSWTLAGWPMAQMLWPGQTPERRERLLAAMRAGRLVPHALAFTTHTESLDLEDLARGYVYSVEMARLARQPLPTGAKMTDVPSHAWGLATVLARGGVKFFHIGCNGGCTHPDVPLLYWWEGPDGSRVLTMLSSDYGSSLRPPPGWPHKTWLYMWMTGDNHGPPNTQEVHDLFVRAGKELPGVRVRFGRMSDFADAILREKPELPVVRGDMPDTWIHGIGSMPIETQLAHVTRPRIAALEALDTLGTAWGISAGSARQAVREAYENTLLFGEHTWGLDVNRYAGYHYGDEWKKKLAAGDYRFLLEGYAQKRAYAHRAAALVDPAIDARMAALAAAVNVAGPRIVVFNPLPWQRDGAVDVPWSQTVAAVTDVASGRVVPAAMAGGRLRFVAKDLRSAGPRADRGRCPITLD